MKIAGIIPSRYGSTRFPGKPLADIGGKSMIRRVYEQARKAKLLDDVIVATDDKRIYDEVKSFHGNVVITSSEHLNGTSRCAEAALKTEAEVIINIQGDEPFIEPEQIDLLARLFEQKSSGLDIATLIKIHPLNEDLQNPGRVKVVVNKNMEAIYFSRSIIPFIAGHSHFAVHGFGKARAASSFRQGQSATIIHHTFYKHIGIYAYRSEILKQIVRLPPSQLELAESLEQLRWLENGYRIKCALTEHDSISIDTPGDLAGLKF